MAKMESSLKNMLISLGAICLVSAALLSGVNALTHNKIDEVKAQKVATAIKHVVPFNDSTAVIKDTTAVFQGRQYVVHKVMEGDTTTLGYAIESVTSGFGGPINIMVGFSEAGEIYTTAVVSHSETPGLGAKMTDEKSMFRTQFNGKNPAEYELKVKADNGPVEAITASTITSRAFTLAVANAYGVYSEIAGKMAVDAPVEDNEDAPLDGEGVKNE